MYLNKLLTSNNDLLVSFCVFLSPLNDVLDSNSTVVLFDTQYSCL